MPSAVKLNVIILKVVAHVEVVTNITKGGLKCSYEKKKFVYLQPPPGVNVIKRFSLRH
jgi:hypothetical protein